MKIAILGAGGMAGSMMSRYLSEYHEVASLHRSDFDVEKDTIPNLRDYDYVVNCIGVIKQKSSNEKLLFDVNGKFPYKLAWSCNRLIHISSDCVFSGNLPEHSAYRTTDIRDAKDSYGKSKAEGEISEAIVLRTSIIGPSKDNDGLFEWFRNTKENPVKGFDNHWWSGITTLELAKIVNEVMDKSYYKGIYQIASEKISKLHLLHLINSTFNLGKNIIPTKSIQSINRSLLADIFAKPLAEQLYELKEYMK